MKKPPQPKVSVSLSLSPTTLSYTSPDAPNLNVLLTSRYSDPITIYADDVSPALMLKCGALRITDLANGCEIQQTKSTHCRISPPSKVTVPLNKSLFHTLLPNIPVTISSPFSRVGTTSDSKPLAKGHSDSASHLNANHGAYGVDGLEPGHCYVLSLADNPRVHWYIVRWWEYGTKEHVLRAEGDKCKLDGRKVKFGRGPHEAIELDLSTFEPVFFDCRD